MNDCDVLFDNMKTKAILTESILNYKDVGTSVIFPALDRISNIINQKLGDYPEGQTFGHRPGDYTLSLKGGLALNKYLTEFKTNLPLDAVDRKTIGLLTSKMSDYDTTFTVRPGVIIKDQNPNWTNERGLLFSILQNEIINNVDIKELILNMAKKLQQIFTTVTINIEGIMYNAFPLSLLPDFLEIFPDSCDKKIKNRTISYKNKNNLFLVFKSPPTSAFNSSQLGLNFTHNEITENNDLKFILDRILGTLALYERQQTKFIPSSTKGYKEKEDFLFNFEVLDVSVDGQYDMIRDESILGTVNMGEISVLNMASIIYDSYKIFTEQTVSKPEKRCKRLLIFLKVYNIIKKQLYDRIIVDYNIPLNYDTYEKLDKYLLANPLERKNISERYPIYKQIQDLEVMILKNGKSAKFVENVRDLCLDTKNTYIQQEKDQILKKYLVTSDKLFSSFIDDTVKIYDIVKDKSIDRVIQIPLDVDYFSRLILYNNISSWIDVSEQMKQIYRSPPPSFNHGGVKFVKDVLDMKLPGNKNVIVDVMDRIQTFVKNKILISYDIDTFIVEDNQKIIDYKMNTVLNHQFTSRLVDGDSYNWEILNNLQDVGIYNYSRYYKNSKCINSQESGSNCIIYFHKDDSLTQNKSMPFTVIRGNVILRHKYCDINYIANIIDFNVVDRETALFYINQNINPGMSFQLCIMLLLADNKIEHDEYLYLSSLYFFRKRSKPYNRLMRSVVYALKIDQNFQDSIYPFETLDSKLYDKFVTANVPDYLKVELQTLKLNAIEIIGILQISENDILKEVVETRKLGDLYPSCKNPLK